MWDSRSPLKKINGRFLCISVFLGSIYYMPYYYIQSTHNLLFELKLWFWNTFQFKIWFVDQFAAMCVLTITYFPLYFFSKIILFFLLKPLKNVSKKKKKPLKNYTFEVQKWKLSPPKSVSYHSFLFLESYDTFCINY